MEIIFTTLKAIIGWFILGFIGTNLIGLIVRGLVWSPPAIEAPTQRVQEVLMKESNRLIVANLGITMLSLLFAAGYLFTLYHFWNIWMVVAAAMTMVARIPDLLWEIYNGIPITRQNCPRGAFYVLTSLVLWGALPLIWYSLYIG
jgi:hypothetical protein